MGSCVSIRMKLFFGKSAAQPQVSPTDAIMKNKEAIDTLTKRHEFIEKKVRGRSRRLVPLRS